MLGGLSVAVAVAVSLIAACGANANAPAQRRTTVRSAVSAVAPTATLAQLNAYLATVKADAGASVLLPDGRVLWLFGDEATPDGLSLTSRNHGAVQSGVTWTRLPGELQPTVGGVWYWPGAAAVDGGKLVVIWARMASTGEGGPFGFAQTGTVAVTYDASTLAKLSTTTSAVTSSTSSMVKVGTTWQVFGTRPVAGQYGKDVLRWTVSAGKLGTMSSWSKATVVIPATWGAGTDVAVAAEGTHLRLWTKQDDILTGNIVTSSNAGGSWSAATVVATVPTWTYAVHVHPEQAAPCLTYALNGDDAAQSGNYHLYAIPTA